MLLTYEIIVVILTKFSNNFFGLLLVHLLTMFLVVILNPFLSCLNTYIISHITFPNFIISAFIQVAKEVTNVNCMQEENGPLTGGIRKSLITKLMVRCVKSHSRCVYAFSSIVYGTAFHFYLVK